METVDTIMPEIIKLRVHLAPVGYEIDRVVIPAEQMRADKVYLLVHENPSEDKARSYLERIEKKLKQKNIKTQVITSNRFRLFSIIKAVKETILKERENDVYINVASGSKIHAVGCMMACMIFDDRENIHPYYAQAKEYPQFKGKEQQTRGVEEITNLPTYQIRTPNQKLIDTLQIIRNGEKQKITKKELARIAIERNLITVKAREENESQATFASLDKNIIQPLERDWGFVEVEKIGRNRWIKLSKEGEYAAEFLI